MPLFGHSHDDPVPGQEPWQIENARLDGLIEHLAGLSSAQAAAELLEAADRAGVQRARMPEFLAALSGESLDGSGTGDTDKWAAVRQECAVGFQALVIARLLGWVEESTNKFGAGEIYYFVSRDGRAALDRGDVVEVVTRRLLD
jgi:hypothetical protein